MELLIELLIDLILEGSIEISENERAPKWIRYPVILFITLFFIGVILGIFILGVYVLKENAYLGGVLILISFILFISGIAKFTKKYIQRKNIKYD